MIDLLLEDYCQEGCRMFKPVVSAQKDIYIKCEWAAQCRYLKNYLKRTGETDEEETNKETRKENKMIGYKGFDKDLKCRGFQYEIGKTYEMDGEIKLCKRGFHFCENISDCFVYYPICFKYYPIRTYARYAKIEALGDVIRGDDGSQCVTNKIRILEEIPMDEAIKMSNSGSAG